jgi:hypothetical protein
MPKIPVQLQTGFRFIKLKKFAGDFKEAKRALENDWQTTANYPWQEVVDEKACGVIIGTNDVFIDIDNKWLANHLVKTKVIPETFTVKTPGNPGFHFGLKCLNAKAKNLNMAGVPVGEIRTGKQYVVAPNSMIGEKKYEIIKDLPLTEIMPGELEKKFERYISWDSKKRLRPCFLNAVHEKVQMVGAEGQAFRTAMACEAKACGLTPDEAVALFCYQNDFGDDGAKSIYHVTRVYEKKITPHKCETIREKCSAFVDCDNCPRKRGLGGIIKTQQIAYNRRFILTSEGITHQYLIEGKKGKDGNKLDDFWGNDEIIYSGPYEPLEKLSVDGQTLFRIKVFEEKLLPMHDVIEHLKSEGGVMDRSRIENGVNAVSLDLLTRKGHATYGVYGKEGGDEIDLCFDILPFKDMQIRAAKHCEEFIHTPITKEGLSPYFEILPCWHKYEAYPAMGMSVMAPFALELRKKVKMLPVLWHYSPVPHLGKSTVQQMFSLNLFKIYPIAGNTIDSEFRLLSLIDSIGGFININEANNVEWRKIEDTIRSHTESYNAGSRGTSKLKDVEYLSRAILGITSNRFRIKDAITLVRIFKIEFDATKEGERSLTQNNDAVSKLLSQMKPFGWNLIAEELDHVGHSLGVLIDNIDKHVKEIRKYAEQFNDPRRPFMWGYCYEGLLIWERTAIKHGLACRAPTYEEFAKGIVEPVEGTSTKTRTLPVADFIHWWEMWKVKNKRQTRTDEHEWIDTIIGEGEIWEGKTLSHKGKDYVGDVITDAILREYQKEKDYQIDNLIDIAQYIMSLTGIPKNELTKTWRFNPKGSVWGVFIPHTTHNLEEDKEDSPQKDDNKPGEKPEKSQQQKIPKSGQADKIMDVKAYVEKVIAGGHKGASYIALIDHFEESFICHLIESGQLFNIPGTDLYKWGG